MQFLEYLFGGSVNGTCALIFISIVILRYIGVLINNHHEKKTKKIREFVELEKKCGKMS